MDNFKENQEILKESVNLITTFEDIWAVIEWAQW